MRRKMFSSTTTESSIRREKANASPPSVIELMEPPLAYKQMKAASAESGIEKKTASVARRLPRKISTMNEVSAKPIAPSCTSVSIAFLMNVD